MTVGQRTLIAARLLLRSLTAVLAVCLHGAFYAPASAQTAADTAAWLNALGMRQFTKPFVPNMRFTAQAVRDLREVHLTYADFDKLKPADIAKLSAATNLRSIHAIGKRTGDSVAIAIARLRNPKLHCINFMGASITDAALEPLAHHPTLTHLDASNTRITAAAIAYLATTPKLESLDLSWSIDDAGLAVLARHPTLKYLTIKWAAFTVSGMRDVATMPKLESLWLGPTTIGDAGLEALQDAPSLSRLHLFAAENITRTGLAAIARLRNLKVLHLQAVAIGDGFDELAAASNLQALSLWDTAIDDVHGPQLGALRHLRELDLSHTKAGNATLAAAATLPNLTWLSANETRVTDAGLKALGAAGNQLQNLKLKHTQVTDAGIGYLATLPKLATIDISGTNVTDAGLLALAKIKTLQRITAEDTPGITRRGLLKFGQLRPNTKVLR